MTPATPGATDRRDLDAALGGDEDAFRRLIEPHRSELRADTYRMLGSVHDAEDALQEALLRAWRGLAGFEGTHLRAWLYKIATNICLDEIARRPKRELPNWRGGPSDPNHDPGEPLAASVWIDPYPDEWLDFEDATDSPEARYAQREAIELAFIAALQQLPGRQRAVVILREVLAFSAREVAASLDTTVASVNSSLQRARKTLNDRLPDRSQQSTLRAIGDDQVRDLVERFVSAFEARDIEAIIALLTEDATFAMPPYAEWYEGRDAISDSWLMPTGPPGRLSYVRTGANGQVAVAAYGLDPETGTRRPVALDVLTLRGSRISGVMAFRAAETFEIFGLPDELPE